VLASLIVSAGCAPDTPLGEVEGTVRLDGRPAGQMLVSFLPDPERGTRGPRSVAATDAQGRYRLRSDDQRDGAAIGWHRVVIEDLAAYATPREERSSRAQAITASRIPRLYSGASETPLRFEVKPGSQTIDLDLFSRP